jgi:serine/threonine-protein kinase
VSLTPGTRLGPYEITVQIGAGGMGEVYRARDTNLGRDVAIKILPEAFTDDAERRARFKREAQMLASLNHSNIAGIFGLEESDGVRALVMELVEGPTLADRISEGRLPVDEALPIARQIAAALQAAHEAGIVHRDLKPANVKVRDDGATKVLDFGLAKLIDAVEGPAKAGLPGATQSPTITTPAMTVAGVILGTAAYMSPEQAKGRSADKRADTWAFGCVLYEMLTGRAAFRGDDISDTLANVLKTEPDWAALPPETSSSVRTLIRGCLEKDRARRIADISTALFVIDNPGLGITTPDAAATPTASTSRFAWSIAAAVVLTAMATGGAAWWASTRMRPPRESPPVARFLFTLPADQQFSGTIDEVLAISPDGSRIVYRANQVLFVRPVGAIESTIIPGSEGGTGLAFSPDGRSLAFFAAGALKRLDVGGGTAAKLCDLEAPPLGISWTGDGVFFATSRGIMQLAESGGTPKVMVSAQDGEVLSAPQMLPDHRTLLFATARSRELEGRIVVQSIDGGAQRTIVEKGSNPKYARSGHIVYVSNRTLYALPFDASALQATHDPVTMIEGVRGMGSRNVPSFSISETGALVYLPGSPDGRQSLSLIDRKGNIVDTLTLAPAHYESPRLSPDGRRLAASINDGKEANIWIYDLDGSATPRRLTFTGRNNRFPVWSPDSERIAFQSDQDGDSGIFLQSLRSGKAERLTKPEAKDEQHVPHSWSMHDDRLAFTSVTGPKPMVWVLSLRERKVSPFAEGSTPTWSPDGRWLAYQNTALTVVVEPYPPSGEKYQVPDVPSHHPLWSRDGSELYYMGGRADASGRSQNVLSIRKLSSRPQFSFGAATLVPATLLSQLLQGAANNYDVDREGRLLTPVETIAGESRPTVLVVLNWNEELKQRVPAR